MAIKISGTTVIDNDESFNIGTFTTAARPASPSAGTLIYNTDQGAYEYYNGSSWSSIKGSDPQIQVLETSGTLLHTLDNPNAYGTGSGDQFGISVAISGNRAIVGVSPEDDAGGTGSGKAYIFDVNTGLLIYTLHNPNAYSTSAGDAFGASVDISGNRAIVSATLEDDAGGSSSGIAYIFDVVTGNLLHTLNNPNAFSTSVSDNFGDTVAISGNYAIVGVPNEDDSGVASSGKAYIFDVESGTLLHTLDNPNAYGTSAGDAFGASVDISGNRAIVGADTEDDAGGTNSGKAYIFDVATGNLLRTLSNPNAYSTSASDQFGFWVSISGNHALVGAYREDDTGGADSGKAYIFDVESGTLLHTLDNPNAYSTSAGDWFGYQVSISGNHALVSTYKEDDTGGADSGKAYIFDVTTGSLLYTLDNPDPSGISSAGDLFGARSDIDGNRVIVGALGEDDTGGSSSGKAYIFAVDNIVKLKGIEQIQFTNGASLHMNSQALAPAHAGGELIHVLDNPNAYSTSAGDRFSTSVSISGNRVIIGAYQEDDAGGADSGKAYIFDVTSGALLHTLDNPNAYSTSADDYFGYSVGISGNRAIVGALEEGDAGGILSGKAYIFDVTTGSLLHTLDNPNAYNTSLFDRFGVSIAISGNRAIVGAFGEDDGGANSGKAYIFDVTSGALLHTLDNPNAYSTSDDDRFGFSVSISGDHAIVGAYFEGDAGGLDSGKAYIFDVTTGSLLHTLDNPNAYNTSLFDYFGYSVGISGNRAIVGAPEEDDAGGSSSGKAYIFDVTTGSLLHTLDNPNAYSTSAGDDFGYSVAISDNYVIVGAFGEDDAGGADSGKAYIFAVTSGTLLHTLINPNAYSTSTSDQFGFPVAISDDYAIAGSRSEDDAGGSDSGKVYIFAARDLTYLDKMVTVVS